jgi:hypothetical protein
MHDEDRGFGAVAMFGTVSCIVFAVVVVAFVFGVWTLFRSLRRWNVPEPKDPEAQQAQARLWSTRKDD